MPAGRPTKYKPEFVGNEEIPKNIQNAVYGLLDKEGRVFYVGKAANLKKRISHYRRGHFHKNKGLERKVKENGVNVAILAENCKDLHGSEFDEIENRRGLVNKVIHRDQAVIENKSLPWNVKGVRCPTQQYLYVMRNQFGDTCEWLKERIKICDRAERMNLEWRFAQQFIETSIGPKIKKWIRGQRHGRA